MLPQLDELVAAHPGLCLLASGDPMLHGIGATLARRLGPGRIRVLPAVSSVALACARLGWAEHETDVVSVVSRRPEAVLPVVQPGARVLVLCRDGATPTALAALLADRGWSATGITVLEHLGGPQERARGPFPAGAPDPGRFADLCVAALACEPDAPGSVLPRVPGLPDAAYETDGAAHPPRGQGARAGRAGTGPWSAALGRRRGQRQHRHRVDAHRSPLPGRGSRVSPGPCRPLWNVTRPGSVWRTWR